MVINLKSQCKCFDFFNELILMLITTRELRKGFKRSSFQAIAVKSYEI